MKYRVVFLSVVPSPYQRDIFAALARRDDVDLRVDYLEAAAPDSPWPEKPLPDYSRILRGFWFPIGSATATSSTATVRYQVPNWSLGGYIGFLLDW